VAKEIELRRHTDAEDDVLPAEGVARPRGRCSSAFCADGEVVGDIDILAEGVSESLAELAARLP
jgi:hypothetical protein